MIVDTSALVAVLTAQPERMAFLRLLRADSEVKVSAVTFFKFGMVVDRWKEPLVSRGVEPLLSLIEAEIVAVSADTARSAREAYATFGKGNHPAKLNFGDCFAYALAKQTGESLLFKGDDFAQTDVVSAV
ncbi:type II toxin-antitoxin system VapC family toxin [Brevundimonas sp. DC300-4]|uniref:type II toxin-antitoxin system VapC family toxin n=1 Tax=Brevundimonas sp. DC300-4 TaxID=2804594 RepID=UPI003CF6E9E1